MKYLTTITILLFTSLTVVFSQACLPYGITIESQITIDHFQQNYPGCTEIGGSLTISGDQITDLTGLSVLTKIKGSLNIISCNSLDSLSGLQNVDSIGENLNINYNEKLKNLNGLDKLISFGGSFNLQMNPSLKDLHALSNLKSIGGNLMFVKNESLHDLSGLNNLDSIGGNLDFWMTRLYSFAGLNNLQSINGYIRISENYSLLSLNGLDNIDPSTITNLTINGNYRLTECNAQSICEYLSNPNGVVAIYSNGAGCNNPGEMANSCGFKMPCLPYGHYYFMNQSDVDGFLSYFDECLDLKGGVVVGWHPIEGSPENHKTSDVHYSGSEDNINNLLGLRGVTSIEGGLFIRGNHILNNLKGLDSLKTIGGNLGLRGWVYNQYLESLEGLENLESIGGGLFIAANSSLKNLDGLKNLKSIGGPLEIGWRFMYEIGNDSLKSLKGLENIDPATITNLKIVYNKSLSECNLHNICTYLAAPNGTIEVHDNGQGCSSESEIEEACGALAIPEFDISSAFTIYPNPASNELNIIANDGKFPDRVNIYNQLGELVITNNEVFGQINISFLPDGLYFLEIIAERYNKTLKLIIN